jgi:hypothetical protein
VLSPFCVQCVRHAVANCVTCIDKSGLWTVVGAGGKGVTRHSGTAYSKIKSPNPTRLNVDDARYRSPLAGSAF